MIWRFRSRLALLDERTDDFLKTLVLLGGYCTAEQAQKLGVAQSPTRVLAHLKGLERIGFLRKVAAYPVAYQVTKSTTRLLVMDRRARRRHAIETVRTRLLGVNFYLEALRWPAEFVFDHDQKVAAFRDYDCPLNDLPQRSGRPYLREEFVLRLEDKRLCAAIVDHSHRSAFLQLWGLAKRFCPCLERLRDRLELLIAVGSEGRYRLYCQLVCHPSLQKLSRGRYEVSVTPYRVRRGVPLVRSLAQPHGGRKLLEIEPGHNGAIKPKSYPHNS